MDVDLEELAAIVELLDKADFTEFRFDKGDLHILVRRGGLPAEPAPAAPPTPMPESVPESVRVNAAAPASSSAQAAKPSPLASVDVAEDEEGTEIVRSPMLGTFYRSPKPGEPPFAQIGDKVDAGAVVCIVEVMKLMNSVRAGVSGQVVKVFATEGQLVEFDQPLFAVKVAS
jgi:acetyl-CoA carboxylase biotin carboxyl carrier protein